MIEHPRLWDGRLWDGRPLFVALCVLDGMRWLGWWLLKSMVLLGSVRCGLVSSTDCLAELRRPRALRHDIALRREVRQGLAQLDAYLSAHSPADDSTRPSDEQTRRSHRAGGDD